jgi:hypothetical protein
MAQAFITIVIPFAKERHAAVDEVLASLADPHAGNAPLPGIKERLDGLAIVHYMSVVAVGPQCPAAASEDPHDRDSTDSAIANLMIEIAADGGVTEALRAIVGALGSTGTTGGSVPAGTARPSARSSAAPLE